MVGFYDGMVAFSDEANVLSVWNKGASGAERAGSGRGIDRQEYGRNRSSGYASMLLETAGADMQSSPLNSGL